jgi:hypothetical protein
LPRFLSHVQISKSRNKLKYLLFVLQSQISKAPSRLQSLLFFSHLKIKTARNRKPFPTPNYACTLLEGIADTATDAQGATAYSLPE